ncbi:MAG: T9SS type A sorting domain-containing protein [Bacteroidales bacterium]|nr:T9SS type A sorting domain-containing protein [Bacteroidales bacterium]MCF8455623.1 T9SS type A sorting domain-containing protein [Bacteroidales bacterium]
MKKFTLLSLILAFSFSMFAQTNADWPSVKKNVVKGASPEMSIKLKKYNNHADFQRATKSFGDTIAYDDFSTGGPTVDDLPTGWTTEDIDGQNNNYTWLYTTTGTTGSYGSDPFESTTEANGWMMYDSDGNGQGSYDAFLYSPTYNCSAYSSVAIAWEEFYRRWGLGVNTANPPILNPYGENYTFVGVSVDGGITYTEIEIHVDFETGDVTNNPAYYLLNISNIAGSQASVKIYFRMQGLWDYWWHIDDFSLVEAPDNDIRLVEGLNYFWDSSAGIIAGPYARLPLSQVMDNVCGGSIYNNGFITQTDVTFEATIWNSANSIVYNETEDTTQLAYNDTVTLYTPNTFVPTTADKYTVAYQCYQFETEQIPIDNVMDTISYEITNNKIFARDRPERFTHGATSPSLFGGGLTGDFVGVDHYVPNTETVNSISVYVDYRTTPYTTIKGQIYQGTVSTTQTEWIGTDEFTIMPWHLGTWVTIPIYIINPGSEVIPGGSHYIVGVECYYNAGERVYIGDEDAGYPHMLWYESVVRLTTDWFWISNGLPLVRLNMDGAILPPQFTSVPDTLCYFSTPYEDTITAVDPQNLPLTLTATINNPDLQLTYIDNGDGTISISTIAPSTANPVVLGNTSFRITVFADNGTETNEQYYWVDVVYPDGTEELVENPVNIYPNPTTGILNVENVANSTIIVYNIVGEQVASIEQANNQARIDLNEFAEGTYIVKVITNNNVVSKKINLIK